MQAMPARLVDIQAECAVLSAAVDREDWRLEVLSRTTIEDYTTAETRAVFAVVSKMHERGEEISFKTIITLHGQDLIDAGYITTQDLTYTNTIGSAPLEIDFPGYMQTLKEMTARRNVYRAAQTAINLINKGEMSDVAFAEIEKAVIDRTATGMDREMLTPADMAKAIEDSVNERMDADKRRKTVIYSTFGKLNKYAGGFEKGDLIILSAESGAGKSAFSMNLAYGIALFMRRPLLYLNSEMTKKQNALRWASFLSKVSHSALRNGSASKAEADAAIETKDIMGNSKLYTLNMPDMQIAAVLSEVRRAKAKWDIEIAIVDYIGRMDTMNLKDAKDWQVMKSAAQRLKTLAAEIQIPIIMVAQLTSDGSRLAQSSYMSHEADLWVNISKIKEEKLEEAWPWNYVLTFKKARNVENGKEIPMRFNGDTLTFTDKKDEAEKLAGEKPALAGMKLEKGAVPY